MFEQVKTIIVDLMHLDPNQISEQSSLKDDLTFDSLMILELVLELESHFNVQIDDQEVKAFQHVQDIINCIKHKQSS
jgi:acyl carrier protein